MKQEQPTSINPAGQEEVIDIFLTKEKTPIAYAAKLKELIEISGMTQEEAEETLSTQPIQIEILYSYNLGLWAIESEALESIEPFCPYSGIQIENPDNCPENL
jgi:hypothetical protein